MLHAGLHAGLGTGLSTRLGRLAGVLRLHHLRLLVGSLVGPFGQENKEERCRKAEQRGAADAHTNANLGAGGQAAFAGVAATRAVRGARAGAGAAAARAAGLAGRVRGVRRKVGVARGARAALEAHRLGVQLEVVLLRVGRVRAGVERVRRKGEEVGRGPADLDHGRGLRAGEGHGDVVVLALVASTQDKHLHICTHAYTSVV